MFESDYIMSKGTRLINIYERLNKGEFLSKEKLVRDYGINLKTVQRDMKELRIYLSNPLRNGIGATIKFDRAKGGYYLDRFEREWLTNSEVLALCKILLGTRVFNRAELNKLLDKLITQVVPDDRKKVTEIIKSEKGYYAPLKHNKNLLNIIWQLSTYINNNEIIRFKYTTKYNTKKEPVVKPISILFSEFYFYLVCFLADNTSNYPIVFRIDRITSIIGTKEKFRTLNNSQFDEEKFRKSVHFMYSGNLKRVKFEYSGPSIEAVLDRLPTAKILKQDNNLYTITAESYGDGVYMWLKSQGDWVRILE